MNATATPIVLGTANEDGQTVFTPTDAMPEPINAPKVLLLGEMGVGKSTSIRSLVDLGFEVFLLALEPGWQDILGDLPEDKLKVHYIPAYGGKEDVAPGHNFDRMLDAAKLLNTKHHDMIQKEGGQNKQNHTQLWDFISSLNDFKDDRTGKSYGDVAMWDHNRALVIEGVSGLSEMAVRNTIGDKPFMELRDYSAAQFLISQLTNGITSRTKALVVMSAHLERESDPNTGAYRLMPSLPGKALAPIFPRFFSDSIHCKRIVEGVKAKYQWDTLSSEVLTKTRNLPVGVGLEPNFKQLITNWRKRVGLEK